MIQLLSPIYLWGLIGLLIPVAVHLLSRKTYTTVAWPVIQFIPESTSRKAATIHWEDTLLFIFRVAIITILVLILTNPIVNSRDEIEKRSIILIAPELQLEPSFKFVLDTLQERDNVYLFKKGFPTLQENGVVKDEIINYWTLLKTLPGEELKEVTVYSPSFYKYFDGIRPSLSFPVNWYVWPVENQETEIVTTSLKNNVKGTFTNSSLIFSKIEDINDSAKTITYYIDSVLISEPYINDGINALLDILSGFVNINEVISAEADIIFTGQDISSTSLVIKVDNEKRVVNPLQKINGIYHIHQSVFKVNNMIKTDLVIKFFNILSAANIIPQQEIIKQDLREMPLFQIQPKFSELTYNNKDNFIYLSSYLWMVLIVLIIIERMLVMKQAK